MKKYLLIAALILTTYSQVDALDLTRGNRSLVFDRNMDDSKFYRIPGLATLPDGRIVAVADKRIDDNSDLPGRIDVVCRLSDDNGATWSDVITVAKHDEGGGYGDPAIVYDKKTSDLVCIFTHGQGLWEATDGDNAKIMVNRSSDRGITWSEPYDITSSLFSSYKDGDGPVCLITGFATSGRALQMQDGRIMFVLIGRPEGPKWGPLGCYAVYSDDGGYTWAINPTPVDTDGDEAKVVELANGDLMMSIRNRRKGERKMSISKDKGATWSEVAYLTGLKDPACNGDIIAFRYQDKDLLLHSLPDDSKDRTNVSVLCSEDNGASWTNSITVCPTESAYSSITPLANGNIGILTEEGCSEGGYRLWFTELEVVEDN